MHTRMYVYMHTLLIVKVMGIHSRTLFVMEDILRRGGCGVKTWVQCAADISVILYNTNQQNAQFS
jgi:hypothetical protein